MVLSSREQYRLTYSCRNNNKPLDLSRTVRLSGLTSGAKLELVQISRSPSVVSVALQLPESEAQSITNGRLTEKFPSNTTLWLILRKFESGKVGEDGVKRNFTARGVPQALNGNLGAGRLYYEQPILNVIGRELSSFTDLQKTLAQLGLNSGTALLRLSFRQVVTPLEQAMEQIGQYFESEEADVSERVDSGPSADVTTSLDAIQQPVPGATTDKQDTLEITESVPSDDDTISDPVSSYTSGHESAEASSTTAISSASPSYSEPSQRAVSIFAPPSSTTPQAARQAHRDSDYEVTIGHAKLHQSRLSTTGQNKRLPTHAEAAVQEEAQAQKIADIKEVEVKVRFPDQSLAICKFINKDTAETLYTVVRDMLHHEDAPFSLNFSSGRGPKAIPKFGEERLIGQLGMTGRVLVNFIWDEGASSQARVGRTLKAKYAEQAREIQVNPIEGNEAEPDAPETSSIKGNERENKSSRKGPGAIPKWMKIGRKG